MTMIWKVSCLMMSNKYIALDTVFPSCFFRSFSPINLPLYVRWKLRDKLMNVVCLHNAYSVIARFFFFFFLFLSSATASHLVRRNVSHFKRVDMLIIQCGAQSYRPNGCSMQPARTIIIMMHHGFWEVCVYSEYNRYDIDLLLMWRSHLSMRLRSCACFIWLSNRIKMRPYRLQRVFFCRQTMK